MEDITITQEVQIPFQIGQQYVVRTVTNYLIGRVKSLCGKYVELEDASWVAQTARFTNFVKQGDIEELEPVGDWGFNADSVVDYGIWKHALPKKQMP